jgi:hypothetical protein
MLLSKINNDGSLLCNILSIEAMKKMLYNTGMFQPECVAIGILFVGCALHVTGHSP